MALPSHTQSSISSSSSSSFYDYGFTYDVFLSVRGIDTRYGFTGNLYRALRDKGIHTFIDDGELQVGDKITPSFFKAFIESRILIPVLSINYASSSYCLDELVHIIHCFKENSCFKENRRLVLPIFYDVEPSYVRHQDAEHIIERFQNSKDNMKRLQKWKMVLTQTAKFSGHHFNPRSGNEFEFISGIVSEVYELCAGVPLHGAISDVVPDVSQTPESVSDVSQTPQSVFDVSQTPQCVPDVFQTPHSVSDVSQTPHSVHDHVSLTVFEVNHVSQQRRHRVFQAETTWKVVALISGFVGLLCYALSPSFDPLIRRWKPFSIIFYIVVCLVILGIIWFAKQASPFTRQSRNRLQFQKACTTFAVLIIIPVYSFVYDKVVGEKPHILSVISNVMFTIMSLSLHKQTNVGFEIGVTAYFFGCFTIQMLTINCMLVFVAIIFGFLLFVLRSL